MLLLFFSWGYYPVIQLITHTIPTKKTQPYNFQRYKLITNYQLKEECFLLKKIYAPLLSLKYIFSVFQNLPAEIEITNRIDHDDDVQKSRLFFLILCHSKKKRCSKLQKLQIGRIPHCSIVKAEEKKLFVIECLKSKSDRWDLTKDDKLFFHTSVLFIT